MKKLLCTVISILCLQYVFAQLNVEEVQQIQKIWGKEKNTVINEFLRLDAANQPKFDGLYAQYQAKRNEIGAQRISLLQDYAKNYAALDDANAKSLTKNMLSNNRKLDKLYCTYYKKISKAVGPLKAAQWLQLESYIDNLVKMEIAESLPFIETAIPKH